MESVSDSLLTPYTNSFDTDVLSVAFHPTEHRLATGSSDATAKIWTFTEGDLQSISNNTLKKKPDITSNSPVNSVSISDNSIGYFLAITSSNSRNAKVFDITNDKIVVNLTVGSEVGLIVSCVACHPIMNLIVTGDNYANVNVWSMGTPMGTPPKYIATLPGHERGVLSLAFHPMLNLFASGSFDKTAKLWTIVPDGRIAICVATLSGHTGYVASVAFHPRISLLATGSFDKTAKIWRYSPDISIVTCVATLTGHTDFVLSVAFHPTVPLLATGSRDMTAKLWRFLRDGTNATCVETITYTEKVRSLSFHPMLPVLAICHDGDNSVTLYDCTKIPPYYDKYMKDMESITKANLYNMASALAPILFRPPPGSGIVPQEPLSDAEIQFKQRLGDKLKQCGKRGGSKRAKTRYKKRSRTRCKSRSTSKTR
jgi:WD40 repeat protein